MREVSPGDIIFSFRDRRISVMGIAQSYSYECPKPDEFGKIGSSWDMIGWKVDVLFKRQNASIRPKDHIALLRPLLPARYSPLQPNGDGMQSVYLAEIDRPLAECLSNLLGKEASLLVDAVAEKSEFKLPDKVIHKGVAEWEDHIQRVISTDNRIPATEKDALIKARRGQGVYKQRLMKIEEFCRITKVENCAHLRGSHIKPWRDSNNIERLDGENGLLLTPSIDHLFDEGFISFENNGRLLISPIADHVSLNRMGVRTDERVNVGEFSQGQKKYLDFHRESILKQATRNS